MPMRKIVILSYDGAQILDITGPAQVFASANEARDTPTFDIVIAGFDGQQAKTTCGIQLGTTPYQDIAPGSIDTLIVVGGHDVRRPASDDALLAWVRTTSKTARRVASVCTGTFILAAAGILDGRRVATHWQATKLLQDKFEALTVDEDALYVTDGKVWTSAGVTAGIDMSLALVEADMGRDIAMLVAKRLVVYARRPGNQSQFSTLLEAQSKGSSPVARAARWMESHIKSQITVADAADAVGMSERSFHRKFVSDTGMTPARYLERLRLDAARSLLENPGLPLKTVAADVGFGSPVRLIQVFERRFGLSPTAYRKLHGGMPAPQSH